MMVSQLFYHIICPNGGSPSELIASIEEHLSNYPEATKKIVVFDKNIINTSLPKTMRGYSGLVKL